MKIKFKAILPDGSSYDWGYQGPRLSMGRDPRCEMPLDGDVNRQVSWLHAQIECDGGTALVRDFHSKNGTYVNEEKVAGACPIQVGDAIRLGHKGPKFLILELVTSGTEERDAEPLAADEGLALGSTPPPVANVSPSGQPGINEKAVAQTQKAAGWPPTPPIAHRRLPPSAFLAAFVWMIVAVLTAVLVAVLSRHASEEEAADCLLAAQRDEASTDCCTPVVIDVCANDIVVPGETPTLCVPEKSSLGAALAVTAEGKVSYDPRVAMKSLPADETRTDEFDYTLEAASGKTSDARVRVVVRGRDAPPPPPRQSPEQLKTLYGKGIVWIGAEREGKKLPLCSGWAAAPNTVITTAWAIAQLRVFRDKGMRVFACSQQNAPTFTPVLDLAIHPLYDERDPDKPANVTVDIGVVKLEGPLPVCCPFLARKDLPSPPRDEGVTAIGFSIPYVPSVKVYDELSPPQLILRQGRVSDTKTFPQAADDLPALVLQVDAPDGMDGSPVFHDCGKVLGVLLRVGPDRYVVLADRVAHLIKADHGKSH